MNARDIDDTYVVSRNVSGITVNYALSLSTVPDDIIAADNAVMNLFDVFDELYSYVITGALHSSYVARLGATGLQLRFSAPDSSEVILEGSAYDDTIVAAAIKKAVTVPKEYGAIEPMLTTLLATIVSKGFNAMRKSLLKTPVSARADALTSQPTIDLSDSELCSLVAVL